MVNVIDFSDSHTLEEDLYSQVIVLLLSHELHHHDNLLASLTTL
jgi:hypothetical protein